MEKLSKMTLVDLQEWLLDKEMPMEVTESFEGGDVARVIGVLLYDLSTLRKLGRGKKKLYVPVLSVY